MTFKELSVDLDRIPGKRVAYGVAEPRRQGTIPERLVYLLSADHRSLPSADEEAASLAEEVRARLGAFERRDAETLLELHKALFVIYETSFVNPLSPAALHENSAWLAAIRGPLEEAWLASEQPVIERELPPEGALRREDRLAEWFNQQASRETPLDRKVVRFLAEEASLEQFKTFLLADAHLNYRFYDALVLAMRHYSETVKEELSHHLWDECGCGTIAGAHTRLFTKALLSMELGLSDPPIWDDWRPYAGYNLYLLFGLSRQHQFKALGSLAMPELFDPDRDRAVIAGLERHNLCGGDDFEYYSSHIEADEEHGPGWLNNVILPIARAQPEAARELAIGGAVRMEYMRRFNGYLAKTFGLED